MRRFLFLALPIAVIGFGATFAAAPRAALACSSDPLYNPLKGAAAVVYGHFDRIAHDSARPSAPYDPSLLTIGIDRTLVGDPLPAFIEAHADVPLPGVPVMCPQFDRTELVGRHAVVALYRDVDGSWSTNWAGVWFDGDSRLTVRGDVLARLLDPPAAPSSPVAVVNPTTGTCDTPFVVTGSGWPADAAIDIQVNGGFYTENGIDFVPNADGDGSFEMQLPLKLLTCHVGDLVLVISAPAVPQARPVTLHARVLGPGEAMPAAPNPPNAGSGASASTGLRLATGAGGAMLLLSATLLGAWTLGKRRSG